MTSVFFSHSRANWPFVHQLIDTLEAAGIEVVADKESVVGPVFMLAVEDLIAQSDLVIADLSDANPNVMYEVGFAHALRKPVIPIVREGVERIPASLNGYQYFVYDPDNLTMLGQLLTSWIERHIAPLPTK